MDFDFYRIEDHEYVFEELDENDRQEVFEETETDAEDSMHGDSLSVYHLGLLYLYGVGCEKDVDYGIDLITEAAQDGLVEAQNQLGWMYRDGVGVEQDYKTAFKWFLKAADQGDALAQRLIGVMCLDGEGVLQDNEAAFKWTFKAANQGDDRAQSVLGWMYRAGEGVGQDYEMAFEWYLKAAGQGYDLAQQAVGSAYYNGEGVEQDYEEAFKWFQKAAKQGYAKAQCCVGMMYCNGEGVEQDYEEAFEWFLKAANQGDSDAQRNIGEMYRDGDGVEENKELAEEWFRKAAANGDEDAQEALKALQAEREEEILGELDALTGLASIKEDVHRLFKVLRTQKKRHDMGLKVPEMTYHCVFSGNPGTGKTTVARILAKIYQVTGVVKTDKFVEAGREDLVAEYLGQTAIKTNALIDSAIDGVLFIDEAYSLSNGNDANGDSYGREAIETLLRRMENDRDRLVVIVAGYTKEMRQFIDSNPGLRSRFTRFFEFPDYTADELAKIFSEMAKRNDYDVSSAVKAKVVRLVEECLRTKPKNFGNAREIRKLYEEAVARQAARIDDMPSPTEKDMRRLSVKDIPNVMSV